MSYTISKRAGVRLTSSYNWRWVNTIIYVFQIQINVLRLIHCLVIMKNNIYFSYVVYYLDAVRHV